MELIIKPHHKNSYPRHGVLVQGTDIESWLVEIQKMQLSLPDISVYPLPDVAANLIWGCLVVPDQNQNIKDIGRNAYCQLVEGLLYIPEYSTLYPIVKKDELSKLLKAVPHILHPKYGLFELEEKLDWKALLMQPSENEMRVTEPVSDIPAPSRINSFQIAPLPEEELQKQFEQLDSENAQKEFEDKPLTWFEKAKLKLYKNAFGDKDQEISKDEAEASWYMQELSKIAPQMGERMAEDYENLHKRNQDNLDKLLELLANDLDEGLKYAIPLDDNGSSRGGESSSFDFSKKNIDLSSFSSLLTRSKTKGSGGGYTMEDDAYHKLREQYKTSAKKLIEKGDYLKASYVYIKLLRDPNSAASTLADARMYQEAATVYLELLNNKPKAAECYENGKMYLQAIELYKILEMYEKTGDIYTRLNKKADACIYYQKVVDQYANEHQFVKASLICKNKMHETETGQALLLKGWRSNADACNCMNNYFANIDDTKTLGKEIEQIYKTEVNGSNNGNFLNVIRNEYAKTKSLAEPIRDIAYEIITDRLPKNPQIISELARFNETDKQLAKDTLRYKLRNRE